MIYAQPIVCPGEWDAQTPRRRWDINGSLNLSQTTRLRHNQQKKETCQIVDFRVQADHIVRLKESEKMEWKNCRTGKWRWYQLKLELLVQSIKDWYKAWRTWKWVGDWRPSKLQHFWNRSEYWEESWRLKETCFHSKSSEESSTNACVKNTWRN